LQLNEDAATTAVSNHADLVFRFIKNLDLNRIKVFELRKRKINSAQALTGTDYFICFGRGWRV
jgi:hypothetical protein